jgi:hypothetical protein
MDTKGLPTNGIHYRAQGHVKIGIVCAQRWLSMHYNYGGLLTIVHNYSQPSAMHLQPSANAPSIVNVFDVLGRKLMTINGAWGSSRNSRIPNYCFIITATKISGGLNGVMNITINGGER